MQIKIEYLRVTDVVNDQTLLDASRPDAVDGRMRQPRHCLRQIVVNYNGRIRRRNYMGMFFRPASRTRNRSRSNSLSL